MDENNRNEILINFYVTNFITLMVRERNYGVYFLASTLSGTTNEVFLDAISIFTGESLNSKKAILILKKIRHYNKNEECNKITSNIIIKILYERFIDDVTSRILYQAKKIIEEQDK